MANTKTKPQRQTVAPNATPTTETRARFRLRGKLLHLSVTPKELKQLLADLARARSTLAKKLIPRDDAEILLKVHYRLNPIDWLMQHPG
jgi:hypothetical protein